MNILVLADEESPALWDYFEKRKLDGIDLILSCGDLDPEYLSFLATFTHAPVLYVRGNHDDNYVNKPPEGCICIDDKIYVHEGIRILGLGGSYRYKPGIYQYTQYEMFMRVLKLGFHLKRRRGFDILLTHAPAYQIDDDNDIPHTGFKSFRYLLNRYKPKYFIHGHIHLTYGRKHKRRHTYKETQIINGFGKYVFEFESGDEVKMDF